MMRNLVFVPALLALAACGGANEAADPAPQPETAAPAPAAAADAGGAGFEALAPGNYELVPATGEAANQMTINVDKTWSMVLANGEAAGGTMYKQGGRACFVTEGVEAPTCYDIGQTGADGSLAITDADGAAWTVRAVASFE